MFLLAPFYGYGSGNYRLTSVKEIKVTEEFMSLDLKTKNCQNETTLQDCQQAKYIKNLTLKCQCIPYNLRNYSATYQGVNRICLFVSSKNLLHSFPSAQKLRSHVLTAFRNPKIVLCHALDSILM